MNETAADLFDISTHNGTLTIKNPRTQEHRTVKIETNKKDGSRWVSILNGPNNESDFVSFAIIGSDGKCHVFKRLQGSSFFSKLANIVNHPAMFANRLEFLFEGRCRICNRKLTDPTSIKTGIGPTCGGRS